MKNILLLLLEIVFLLVGGCFVFPLLFVVGVIYSFVKHVFFKFDYSISKQLTPILRSMTLVSDGLACAGAGELLNDFYKIPKDFIVRYGKWYQTISAVTGILKVYLNRDLPLRKSLKILGKNHCEEAITPQEHVYYEIMCKEVK